MAAYYGQGNLIDLLVQNGAVVDSTDYLGLTPLHLACQRGHQNVMVSWRATCFVTPPSPLINHCLIEIYGITDVIFLS